MRKSKGITLIALIITIIVMIILASVTILIFVSEDGIIKNVEIAKEQTEQKQAEEHFLNDYNYMFIEEDQKVNKETLEQYINEKKDELNVEIKGIEEKENDLIVKYEYPKNSGNEYEYNFGDRFVEKLKKYVQFKGNTYFETGLNVNSIIDGDFTISARVKINEEQQKSIDHMNILGNHLNKQGLVWQFIEKTSEVTACGIHFDYSNYYDEWIDITVTCQKNEKIGKVYINGELQLLTNNKYYWEYEEWFNEYDINLLIGNGYLFDGVSRCMEGNIQKVIVWDKVLNEEEAQKINFGLVENNIQKDNKLGEYNFKSLENYEIKTYPDGLPVNYEIKNIK